ncbi:MAG: MBOAT family protein [Lachnospiraceae bacterium]|nr:MBOAT family protein [Lachnospiraceae bacterium]
MVFSSETFLYIFLPVVLVIYYNPIFKSRGFRNIVLLIASLAFYAYGEPVFVFLMIFSIFVTWLLGLKLDKNKSKFWLGVGTVYHIVVLFIFKYLSFLAGQVGLLLNKDFSFIKISLPIGISFFTFQLMSYLFDVYYGNARVQRNPLYVGLYVSLFPQLIAGPIVRYQTIADAITDRNENFDDIAEGLKRFIYGLGKKVILANYVGELSDVIFSYSGDSSAMTAWLGAIAYTLQIYFDFSGYSDMAIGLGRMFGFSFDENFNYPYIASSVTDFWRRWHISLSTWFRDYVYIPLGGNRVTKPRWILNLFTVWLLTGIWHGANWTFLVWGLLYFVFLVFEKLTGFGRKKNVLTHIYTLVVVIICWVFFRADNLGAAVKYLGTMFGPNAYKFVDDGFFMYLKGSWTVLLAAVVGSTPLYSKLVKKVRKTPLCILESVWVLAILLIVMFTLVRKTYNPFIYFNF